MEHEAGIPLTLSCTAVGHLNLLDDYFHYMGDNERRKFLREYRGEI